MSRAPILSLRHYRHDLIAHSHDHPQLVFGLRGRLEFEVEGRGAQLDRQDLMVVPAGRHHTCGSTVGSDCLVLDVPVDNWLGQSLGAHLDASQRLLERARPLSLDTRQQQLVDWLAASPINDPLIAQQGAVLLLASLNGGAAPVAPTTSLPYARFDAHIEQNAAYPLQVADLARLAGLSSARLHARFMAECGSRPWTMYASVACYARGSYYAIPACRSAISPARSATARKAPLPPPCSRRLAARLVPCAAIVPTIDARTATDSASAAPVNWRRCPAL